MNDAELQIVLESLKKHPRLSRNVVHWQVLEAQAASFGQFPAQLSSLLTDALNQLGIEQLYSHQAQAIGAIFKGKNVVIATFPASGKTLCYNLPALQAIVDDSSSRALYLFPTKALSQDQYFEVYQLSQTLQKSIKIFTFDGDTPKGARRAIRAAGQIVITNPDMLHTGILPHHTLWVSLFQNLKYVVVDEIHQYRGVFGSHFANVIRRLKRLCTFYGSQPQFICCSATIGNPKELAETLIELPFELINESGAPRGEKFFVFYNPPVVNRELGIRSSIKTEARALASRCMAQDVQTIVFARSRLNVEVMVKYLKRAAKKVGKNPDTVYGYRGGYLPKERRQIEKGIKNGDIRAVVSTNALELGIDIGQLRSAIIMGYPGTIASTWQQAGRAGRKIGDSLAVLIADSSPLDQYIISHPKYFFGSSPEMGIINPDNLAIMNSHIKCATFELQFKDGEKFGTADPMPVLSHLEQHEVVRHTGGEWYWSSEAYPAEEISLRSATAENFVVVDKSKSNQAIAEVDYDSAPYLIHREAIYIHQSQTYHIDALDWPKRTAYANPVASDYFTEAQAKTDIQVLNVDSSYDYKREKPDTPASFPLDSKNFGIVSVKTLVAKYKKIKFETHENVGFGLIHLPEMEMQTESYWLTFRPELQEELKQDGKDLTAGLKGLAHLLRNVVPLFVLCDPYDIYSIPMIRAPFDKKPAIYIYDKYPGGVGISRRLFTIDERIMKASQEIVEKCGCANGCPSCVGPPIGEQETIKSTTQSILKNMLGFI